VAAAYWMTLKALMALYPDAPPERGAIRVEFRADQPVGRDRRDRQCRRPAHRRHARHRLQGHCRAFDRRKLLYFPADVGEEIRFTRTDTGAAVEVAARAAKRSLRAAIPRRLMQKCLDGSATPGETAEFRECWQARVRCAAAGAR
jgi:hypothetical protein